MTQILEAVFDGHVIHPDEPVALLPNTRVRIVIQSLPDTKQQSVSFLREAQSLMLEGPEDWAENVDDYLYGERSRHDS